MEDQRLNDIETKIAYLERMISELNDVVYDQHKTIENLEKTAKYLQNRVLELSGFIGHVGSSGNEKPPHY